ncbi:endoglucanase B precursor [Lachnospiraceae bacterium KM106-2]|nr:endoglucanase B precursor [Lachnospiraceae bacterium KM106-2]
MEKGKLLKVVASVGMAMVFTLSCAISPVSLKAKAATTEKSASQKYAEAMGNGLNIGNSFDAFDRNDHSNEIDDETAWKNPVITKKYIDQMKAQGFKSLRIPFTAFTRIDEKNGYKISDKYLDRYEEVVNYALDDGFYVMINLHHDSSEWLIHWDGKESSEEYIRLKALWTQLANRFKDYNDHLMFESVNEMCFDATGTEEEKDAINNLQVKKINQAFYDIVRNSGGKNATRMLVLPTAYTNHKLQYSNYTADFIKGLKDPNVMATVHYYCSDPLYAYTSNIGVCGFDETFKNSTPRKEIDKFYECLKTSFTDNGIGVAIGEYGLFNSGYTDGLETGEYMKYIEYMKAKAAEQGICPMFWEPGNLINRTTGEFNDKRLGATITSSLSERSSYSVGFDELYVKNSTAKKDIKVPLMLNGNSLKAIYNGDTKLTEGKEYTYSDETVTLLGSYVSSLAKGDYGTKADLRFVFSAGADWHEYVIYHGTAVFGDIDADDREDNGYMAYYDTNGSATYAKAIIPVKYNGQKIRKMVSYNSKGEVKSSNTWANDAMQYDGEFMPNYKDGKLGLMNWYLSVPDDTYKLVITFYDGSTASYQIVRNNNHTKGTQLSDTNTEFNLVTEPDWTDGCRCTLTIKNTTGKDLTDGWNIAFDYDREISDVFGADLESAKDDHYVLNNPSYKTTLKAGESVTITFLAGAGNADAVLSNLVLK